MMQFSAHAFLKAGEEMQAMRMRLLMESTMVPRNHPIYNYDQPLSDDLKAHAKQMAERLQAVCEEVSLEITAATALGFSQWLANKDVPRNLQWLRDKVEHLQQLYEYESRQKLFLYITAEKARFFADPDQPHLFGELVHRAFPSAAYDVKEAGACIAVARPTAAVFHLMRVLEIALHALGAPFGVSLTHTNWAPAIEELESKIRKMHTDPAWKSVPDVKSLQEGYAQAASYFGVLKDAWRNYTMHSRGKYTEEEAEHLFANIKFFLRKLTALGVVEKP